jgi:hypothetical protein
VRINDDARKAVVFFGVPDPKKGIAYGGTGFMLCDFEDGIQIPFIVTARHVAKELENYADTGFFIRVNTTDGKSMICPVEKADWAYHPDDTVDLAVANLSLPEAIFNIIYYPLRDKWFVDEDRIAKYGGPNNVLCGDPVSIVGLFRLHPGSDRNVPIVHSGHIAALPDPNERIPINDRTTGKIIEAEAYLVEAQTLDGLSGSPVFTNEALEIAIVNQHHGAYPSAYGALVLLGIHVGAWEGAPGQILSKDRNFSGSIKVPVGMGVVVPAQKIVELISGDSGLMAYRKYRVNAVKSTTAATQDHAKQDAAFAVPPFDDENPSHREDFTALLNAAVRKPQPKD